MLLIVPLPFSILSLCYLATLNFIPSRCFVNPVDTSMWIPITMHSIKAISSCLFHNCLAGSSFLFMSSLLIFFPPFNSVFSLLLCISEGTIGSAIFIPSLLSAGCPLLPVIICLFLVVMIFVPPFIASLGMTEYFYPSSNSGLARNPRMQRIPRTVSSASSLCTAVICC